MRKEHVGAEKALVFRKKMKDLYYKIKKGLTDSVTIHKLLLQGKGDAGDYICSLTDIVIGIFIGLSLSSLI